MSSESIELTDDRFAVKPQVERWEALRGIPTPPVDAGTLGVEG